MLSDSVVLENAAFKLVLNPLGQAESLIDKASGTECLSGERLPFFRVTEARPHLNEIKLAHPNKQIVCSACSLRQEGSRLYVDFAMTPYEAVIEYTLTPHYITFTLISVKARVGKFCGLSTTPLPIEVRLAQLPIAERKQFGDWLNVSFDEQVAVNLLSPSPYARIDSELRGDCRILTADAVREVKLTGTSATLVVSPTAKLLDVLEEIEQDYALPHGVASRRADTIHRSIYWSSDVTPQNVEQHIALAKQGGFTMMLLYYKSFIDDRVPGLGYAYCGEYDRFRPEYPAGLADLRKMLDKIRAAGVIPGLHVLHTHIGIRSHYVTPVADHRLHCVKTLTLSRPLSADSTTIFVEQNPEGCYLEDNCRVLRFGGEIISYDHYTTEPPYCFIGCHRGHYGTYITPHPLGEIGGLLDISEFGASSIYIDQNSDLQDEIAEKIAAIYACGFQFVYFDGSEGTNAPYEYHIPHAQYRVYRRLSPEPLFCEGAARAHFSWHMLSGGNAFDTFPPSCFKEKIVEHPMEEAPRMACDFTRLNFGWWSRGGERIALQPDMLEFAASRAAAWDCVGTLMIGGFLDNNPRYADSLEVLRRWEEMRRTNPLTPAQKEMLKDPKKEHILIRNEQDAYELLPCQEIHCACGAQDTMPPISALLFERGEKRYVVCWHKTGSCRLFLPLPADSALRYLDEAAGNSVPFERVDGGIVLPIEGRRYLVSTLPRDVLIHAFESAPVPVST